MKISLANYRFTFSKEKAKELVLSLFFIFFLVFPKGGVKIQGLPLTWGLIYFSFFSFYALSLKNLKIYQLNFSLYLLFLPFLIVSSLTILFYGYEEAAYAISYLIHFYYILPVFLLIIPSFCDEKMIGKIGERLKSGVFFVALFGLLLFFYKWKTGNFFEIPFLTVNYHDYHELESTKCIDRGGVYKLISTYNNGNLYGICILMILPLYEHFENRRLKKMIVKTSLIFTLSRTIWLGLILSQFLSLNSLKTTKIKKAIDLLVKTIFFIGTFFLLNEFFPLSTDFIFDRFFGNRIGQFKVLDHWEWFPFQQFEEIFEIIYLGLLKSFGLVGLIVFCLAFFLAPLMVYFFRRIFQHEKSAIKQKVAHGMMIYACVAAADGALLLMPVLIFYFFLLFISLFPKKSLSYEHITFS